MRPAAVRRRRPNSESTTRPAEFAGAPEATQQPIGAVRADKAVIFLTGACAALALSACGGGGSPAVAAAPVSSERTVEVLSLPRNCVVEMGGEYLGATPLKISVPTTPDGRWQGPPSVVHSISVSTPNNRFVETKKWRGGDPVPQRLLFRPPYTQQ